MDTIKMLCRYAVVFALLVVTPRIALSDIPIPIPSAHPVALDKLRVNNAAVFPLAGTWRFQLAHGAMERDGYHSSAVGPVTASSSQDGHPPLDALDGTGADPHAGALRTKTMPQWWKVVILEL